MVNAFALENYFKQTLRYQKKKVALNKELRDNRTRSLPLLTITKCSIKKRMHFYCIEHIYGVPPCIIYD